MIVRSGVLGSAGTGGDANLALASILAAPLTGKALIVRERLKRVTRVVESFILAIFAGVGLRGTV